MASLSSEQIAAEVAAKGFKLVDSSKYKNLESEITVQCPKGHNVITDLKSLRHPSFECPFCASQEMHVISPQIVPNKNGFRIIACDQATEKFGVSI
jgi:Zn finger protein HypA/HybF involved in hydrogenase expression